MITITGPYKNYGGDAYDQFGECIRCEKLCHRDTHMYGDSEWTVALETNHHKTLKETLK